MVAALTNTPWENLLGMVVVLILTSAVSLFIAGILLARLPHDYFCNLSPTGARTPMQSWVVRLAKNLLGMVLVFLGAILSLPGVPGPGLLILLLGITLSEFPGKRRFETWVIQRPGVLMTINSIRSWFGKAPFARGYKPADIETTRQPL